MKRWMYAKFAWIDIRKNKQLYYPYLLACITMVMVFYIFGFLSASDVVHRLPGGEAVTELFRIGDWLVGIFSVPFLFYTNATLIKRRKKELGLYNVLGMNKKNLFLILFWEALISYGVSVMGGILSGIVLSKAAELGIVNIMGKETDYQIYVEWKGVLNAILVFAVIFVLILLNMFRQIHNNNPIELMRSESAGERPPKNHWFIALVSLGCIVAAYLLAARLDTPRQAVQGCLIIAALIILGTFLLFICASVALCRIMKSRKKYYYKTSHFVTVSAMQYRMKRNGASLASVCILVTLILVTLVAAVGFYVGSENTIQEYYPYDIGLTAEIPAEKIVGEISSGLFTKKCRQGIEKVSKGKDAEGVEGFEIHSVNMLAQLSGGRIDLSVDMAGIESDQIILLRVLSQDDYKSLCGTSLELTAGRGVAATADIHQEIHEIVLQGGTKVLVDEITENIPKISAARKYDQRVDTGKIRQVFLVVPDLSFLKNETVLSAYIKNNDLTYQWEYDINMPEGDNGQQRIYEAMDENAKGAFGAEREVEYSCYLRSERAEHMNGLSGGLLFLMLVLIIIFVFVTTLILYYKQISEGYEDQKRFLIMRKLGMTKKEIKKSIHSQILTVFSLPLAVAGIHLIFTSQILYLMLQYAVIDDRLLVYQVMSVSYVFFAIVYSLVYFLTSRTYFRIVGQTADEISCP